MHLAATGFSEQVEKRAGIELSMCVCFRMCDNAPVQLNVTTLLFGHELLRRKITQEKKKLNS